MTAMEKLKPIKVILVDDHPLVMEGLKSRLEQETDIQIVATLEDPRQLLDQTKMLRPDVIVMDISMPHIDGFELAQTVKQQFGASVKIVMLSGYTYDEFYQKAYELGVHAYLSKQSSYPQIIGSIRQSMMGHVLVAERVIRQNKQDQLTPTEREVLVLMAKENTNQEIADVLAMSKRTVEYHIASIIQKLGVKTRVGAVAKGYENGLLSSSG
ncbi:response regulator transcription factor [Paenibacillus motobuensis]|uniref:response regulator transcription factor n=1 Tax=Paenibacillus TaxID=44249 RepID=UPI00203B8354|nr:MULTISPECIES: response regulator transcription factor [Paenibacillus]MCM3038920.1 response regulator transcription factor [Paenibacillus lutimineralis]MCM3646024.1 response regulator transcription factor [Paenibacillus motobuensis]